MVFNIKRTVAIWYEYNNPQSYVASVNQASELTSHSSPGSSNVPCSNIAGSSNNVTSYSYDSLGDRISATVGSSNYSYGYNGIGEMTSYSSGGTNNFSYTGDGLEIAGQSGSVTTQLTWDTTGSLPLLLCDGTDDYIYGPSGTPVEQINTTTVQSASLTSPSMDNPTYMSYTPGISSWIISNTAGYFTNLSRYDAYGNLTAGNPGSVFGWQGQYMGSGSNYSGLIYMRARYYDPTSGEFTSMDPLYLSTYQAYEYAGGDPVNGSDPSGKMTHGYCISGGAELLAVILQGSGTICAVMSNNNLVALLGTHAEGVAVKPNDIGDVITYLDSAIENGFGNIQVTGSFYTSLSDSIQAQTGVFRTYFGSFGVGNWLSISGQVFTGSTPTGDCSTYAEGGTSGAMIGLSAGVNAGIPIPISGGSSVYDMVQIPLTTKETIALSAVIHGLDSTNPLYLGFFVENLLYEKYINSNSSITTGPPPAGGYTGSYAPVKRMACNIT